jgi:flavin-binding protein dodecin
MKEFEIIEKVGISDKSYSDAVKNALKNVKKQVHWFEVIDIRGRMTKENTIEFQLILKIGCT